MYDRLQKLMISMSRRSTFSLINMSEDDFDAEVMKWKQTLVPEGEAEVLTYRLITLLIVF